MRGYLPILLLLFCSTIIANECVIKLRVNQNKPFYWQEEGVWKGYSYEQAKALLDEADCQMKIEVHPWKRSLLLMQEGKIDMMISLSLNTERQAYMAFIGPHNMEIMALIVHKESRFRLSTLTDLMDLPGKVEIQRGAYFGKTFNTLYQRNGEFRDKFYEVTNLELNIDRLLRGRTIAYIDDLHAFEYHRKNDPTFTELKAHPFYIHENPVYFGFSKRSVCPETLARLQAAFDRLQQRGEFTRILQKYQ